jgi:SAM-dependent methyltransferase
MASSTKTILNDAYRFAVCRVKGHLLWNHYYAALREPKVKSTVVYNPKVLDEIVKDLKMNFFKVVSLEIDVDDYRQYFKNAKYYRSPLYYLKFAKIERNLVEKSLEHYLAAKLLELKKEDLYIDVASSNSPASDIYHRLYGCEAYKQDMMFADGIHENVIGGDASRMPVKEGFASKMALHCSFEHFENDSDVRFIKEANRVLRKGGKLCILPLYLFNKYAVQTDPTILPKNDMQFEKDAVLYCAKGWGQRHGRFYDVSHLTSRIRDNLDELRLTIYVIGNEKQVDSSCYLKFVALFEKE